LLRQVDTGPFLLISIYRKFVTLPDDAKRAHIDTFILTHPDQDHCRGFEEIFYTGDPSEFNESDRRNGLIIIDELWFAPRIFSSFEDNLSDSAEALKKKLDVEWTFTRTQIAIEKMQVID
jgi:metal-dependent hydrolase (beta-lactamase superfamily II)